MKSRKSLRSIIVLSFFAGLVVVSVNSASAAQVQPEGRLPQPSVDHEESEESSRKDDAYVAHIPSEKIQDDATKAQAVKDHEAYLRRIDRVTRPGR